MRPVCSFGLAICLVILVAGAVVAQQDGDAARSGYDLAWWTVDGGGGNAATGPVYSLQGTAGQPDAAVLSGPGYRLAGGFWLEGVVAPAPDIYRTYLPNVVRSYR